MKHPAGSLIAFFDKINNFKNVLLLVLIFTSLNYTAKEVKLNYFKPTKFTS